MDGHNRLMERLRHTDINRNGWTDGHVDAHTDNMDGQNNGTMDTMAD